MGRAAFLAACLQVGTISAGYAQDDSGAAMLAAADFASVQGRWNTAETLYSQILTSDPDSAEGHSGLGFVLAEQGRFAEAAPHYRVAMRLWPRDAWVVYNLAAVVDATEPRRALSLWGRYVAMAADRPEERSFVARARARIRQLTGP